MNIVIPVFLLFFGIPVSNAATNLNWDLNDVSYLMPLPKSLGQDRLLRMNSAAKDGLLLEPSTVNQIPALTMHIPQEELIDSLRVVAIRLDPCFPLPTPSDCQRQLRLVWQPLEMGRKNQVQTVDAALHSFHHLTENEFYYLAKDILAWKDKYKINTFGLPLQVHPAWAQYGDQSPSLVEFYRIILKYIGPKNLIRVTAMVLRGAGDMWGFVNLEPKNSKFQLQPIARLSGKLSQTFINSAVPANHFEGQGIMPKPQGEDLIDILFADLNPNPINDAVVKESFKSLYRIENPKYYHAENMDCVSCHVTQAAKYYYLNTRGNLQLDQIWNSAQYKNSNYNLENKSLRLKDTQNIRGFGYFGNDIAISQRVINESAEVADWLNHSSDHSIDSHCQIDKCRIFNTLFL